jgi:hypothetical protein
MSWLNLSQVYADLQRMVVCQIYRTRPHELLFGSEARSHRQARKEAQAAIHRLEQGVPA